MAETAAAPPGFDRSLENAATSYQAHDCADSVLKAYSAAIGRRSTANGAFETAVQTYFLYHPNLSDEAARRAVAEIISSKE